MDKVPSHAIYFTARPLCPLLLSQLQVHESEQRPCSTLKMLVHDRYIIPMGGSAKPHGSCYLISDCCAHLWAQVSPLHLLLPLVTRSQ